MNDQVVVILPLKRSDFFFAYDACLRRALEESGFNCLCVGLHTVTNGKYGMFHVTPELSEFLRTWGKTK